MANQMMVTALNETSGDVVSVIDMPVSVRDQVHGRRNARVNGFHMTCRGCHAPVHLVVRGNRKFWRHDPGHKLCVFDDFKPNGEGDAHFIAKCLLADALANLAGFTVDTERTFEADGDAVRPDVYAENSRPAGDHQRTMLWEIQLSRQTHGEFVGRTEQARRVTGHPRAWLTPHHHGLGDVRGIVTDPFGSMITDRLYTDPYMTTALSPVPMPKWATAVARRRPRLLWSQSGEDGAWISYPPHSNIAAPTTREPERRDYAPADDRNCSRPEVERTERTLLRPTVDPVSVKAGDWRPASWRPEAGESCPHYYRHEQGGLLVCTHCGGDPIRWPPR